MSSDRSNVLVTGDVVLDRHIYEGGRSTLRDRSPHGTHIVEEIGGAALTQRLIDAVFEADFEGGRKAREAAVKAAADAGSKERPPVPERLVSRLGLRWSGSAASSWPEDLAGSAWWSAQPKPGSKDRFWRVSRAFGYGCLAPVDDATVVATATVTKTPARRGLESPAFVASTAETPTILVLDDAGDRFRRQESADLWHLPEEAQPPDWIVLKLAGPIGKGDLWDRLMRCQPEQRLIMLVSAKVLRQVDVRLSRGLSWERTIQHLRTALHQHPGLRPLRRARHLIVNFEGDGAVWIDFTHPEAPDAQVVLDPEHAEGEWGDRITGEVFGYQSCLAASVAYTLTMMMKDGKVQPDLQPAIERGLSAMRNLREAGHGLAVSGKSAWSFPAGFPAARLAAEILHPTARYVRALVPWSTSDLSAWSILASLQNPLAPDRPLYGFARQLAIRGESVIGYAPHFHLSKLLTVGREEMETLRSLRRILVTYRDKNAGKKPLSIGVFGPPGSGKSFAVEQLALGIFGDPDKRSYDGWMEFNLSQFDKPADLIGAFHQVRDRVLQGLVPVVFWDEFDAKNYDWLRFLLAPMQDGRFQEGQITHTIGKCVFVFAGGTADTFETFGPQENDNEEKQLLLKLAKAPDFKSRLDGFLNVLGPNAQTTGDIFFPVRRALMIRNLLGCDEHEELAIDSGLLTALLEIPAYEHGARSLGKVLEPFIAARKVSLAPLHRSELPAPNQLSLHVKDTDAFHRLCVRDLPFQTDEVVQRLAPAIHETWREAARAQGWTFRYDMEFDELPQDIKRSNEAAARRIPDILALVGLKIVEGTATKEEEDPVRAQLDRHLELLAEEEHKGWVAHLDSEGWRFAEQRDDVNRLHDCIRPFHELHDVDKGKDRSSVKHFPDFVRLAGFKIVFG